MTPQDAPGYDLRLVPAALTCWAVTAAGIVWQAGAAATVTGAVGAGVAALLRRRTPAGPRRAVLTALLAAAFVGLGFGAAIMLRDNAVRQHPILASVGRQAEVTVLVTETGYEVLTLSAGSPPPPAFIVPASASVA